MIEVPIYVIRRGSSMPTWSWILLIIIALIARNCHYGFFVARRYMMNYFKGKSSH